MSSGSELAGDAALDAAEYALGLTDGPARRAFEQRLPGDVILQAELAGWDEDLAPLAAAITEVVPPQRVEKEIQLKLFGGPQPDQGFWGRAVAWQWLSAGIAVVCAALVLALFRGSQAPPVTLAPVKYVGVLAADARPLQYLIYLEPAENQLRLQRVRGVPGSGRDLQLWLIEGSSDPISLGLLPSTETVTLPLPAAVAQNAADAVFTLSEEPRGGSPTGLISGPIVAASGVYPF